ncbi:MAG: Molybdenum cofactor guanylyltransferase [Pseudomonas citronellolis]|nr:MAG: Molybdenum cofactor guanylyltransferase [Pseudomonas citronellolis]
MPDSRPSLPRCSALLLAGGRGQRMGGRDKGLIDWQGEPLIAHLQRLVRPLTDELIISCNRHAERYAAYADHLVADAEPDYPGPLAGIRAGLALARHPWLLVLPCDSPRLDEALLRALLQSAADHPDRVQMIRAGEHWEPLFCLIPTTLRSAIEQAWQQGERSPRRAFEPLGIQAVNCAADDPRLANLNTPDLLLGVAGKPQ